MPPYLFICLAAGLLSAIVYGAAAANLALSFLAIYFAPLPLFLVGLTYGGASALIAGLAGAGALALASSPVTALAYFILVASAPALVTRAALWSRETGMDNTGAPTLEWYPSGLLFAWLCGLGVSLALVFYFAMQMVDGGISGLLLNNLQMDALSITFSQIQSQTGSPPMDEATLRQFLIRLALPMVAFSWSMIVIGNGALAQSILLSLGRNGRPSPRLASMNLPGYLLWPLCLGLTGSFLPGDPGLAASAIAALAAIPYFFLGLAALHVISRTLPGRGFALTIFYVLLVIYGWPAILMVMMGVTEHFAGFRRRYIAVDSL